MAQAPKKLSALGSTPRHSKPASDSLVTFSVKGRLMSGGNAMKHWQRQPRSTLCLAALLSLLLVQSAFGFPYNQTRINLSPRVLYNSLGSFAGMVLTGGRHIVNDLELLYQLHQLAMGASQPEKPPVPASLSSPLPPAQKTLCAYRVPFRQPAAADR